MEILHNNSSKTFSAWYFKKIPMNRGVVSIMKVQLVITEV